MLRSIFHYQFLAVESILHGNFFPHQVLEMLHLIHTKNFCPAQWWQIKVIILDALPPWPNFGVSSTFSTVCTKEECSFQLELFCFSLLLKVLDALLSDAGIISTLEPLEEMLQYSLAMPWYRHEIQKEFKCFELKSQMQKYYLDA